jgi:hypothetical protein
MWQVDNRTPFAAERGWVRDRNGAEVWLLAVKCTFDIRPDGSTEVSPEQPPVLRVPEYHGEPGQSSLRYEADLVLSKTTTDIIVNGHAYAPGRQSVEQMEAGFRVGPVQKIVRISGDRVWGAAGPSAPRPFTKMPLVYERAFGGVDARSDRPDRDWDWRNPLGTGFAVSREHLGGVALPNIEYPNDVVAAWNDRPQPAGLGPIGSHWQPRAGFAGTYDERWMQTRRPLLPEDFDERFFQCAPQDQQAPGFLRGGEPVVLYRLTPERDLRFALPTIYLGFDTHFFDGSRVIHRARRLHTVILEPDVPRVSLVWHTALACHFKVQTLERTIVTLKAELSTDSTAEDELAEEARG